MRYYDLIKYFREQILSNDSKFYTNEYIEFIKNIQPTCKLSHTKDFHKININLYIDTNIELHGSFSVWAYVYTDSEYLGGQMIQVRYDYYWKKLFVGVPIKQWIINTFNCYQHPNMMKSFRIDNKIEIMDIIENYFEENPKYDLRKRSADENEIPILERFEPHNSFIYLIRDNEKQVIKIGRAKNPKQRLSQINSDTASSITLLASMQSPSALALDHLLQENFSCKRHKNEWYYLNDNDIRRILNGKLPYPLNELCGEVVIYIN